MEELYFNPTEPTAYYGAPKILNTVRGSVERDKATAWLENQDAYTMHRPIRRRYPRRSYNVSNVDDLWEADLVDLRSLKTYNDDYAYLLTVIDVLSKYAWVEPLRDKTCSSVRAAFARLLIIIRDSTANGERSPVCLQTDRGREFLGKELQDFLKTKNIAFRTARNPDIKAAVVERFNRTLKERMWRYFTHTRTKRYIDVLQALVHSYNRARHSTIKMAPSQVTLENASRARSNMMHQQQQQRQRRRSSSSSTNIKYRVGDLVRISRAKSAFAKGYEGGWSEEIFKVERISNNRHPPVYILRDLADEIIDGIFYEQELTRVRRDLEKETFRINEIIRSEGRGRKKRHFVSWVGYPEKFNSWIPASSVLNLQT